MSTEIKPKKVIIAVDMSNWAEAAFDWYVKDIHQPDMEVICFHTVEPPAMVEETDCREGMPYKYAMQGSKTAISHFEETYKAKMEHAKIPGKTLHSLSHRPGEAIVELARKEDAAMVVVGTRGKGKLRRTILGSTSDYVLHHAHCPVVVCCHPQGHHTHKH